MSTEEGMEVEGPPSPGPPPLQDQNGMEVTEPVQKSKKSKAPTVTAEEARKRAEKRRLDVTELNPHIQCQLCKGYLIDPVTVVECLHSFCKSCIIRHVEVSKACPTCDIQIHKTKPLLSLRADKALQDIVYKVVPGLYRTEMQNRVKFYSGHPEAEPTNPEDAGEVADTLFFSPEDEISMSIEYFDNFSGQTNQGGPGGQDGQPENPNRRFLQCPGSVTVQHLKKFIITKYGLDDKFVVDVIYREDLLAEDNTLVDVAYSYNWRKTGPMRFYYRIYQKTKVLTRKRKSKKTKANSKGQPNKKRRTVATPASLASVDTMKETGMEVDEESRKVSSNLRTDSSEEKRVKDLPTIESTKAKPDVVKQVSGQEKPVQPKLPPGITVRPAGVKPAPGTPAPGTPTLNKTIPLKPVQSAKPMQANKPMQASKPMQGGKPLQNGKPVQAGKPLQAGKPVPLQNGKPVQSGKPIQGGKPVQSGKPVQNGKAVQGAKPVQGVKAVQNGKPAQSSPVEGKPSSNSAVQSKPMKVPPVNGQPVKGPENPYKPSAPEKHSLPKEAGKVQNSAPQTPVLKEKNETMKVAVQESKEKTKDSTASSETKSPLTKEKTPELVNKPANREQKTSGTKTEANKGVEVAAAKSAKVTGDKEVVEISVEVSASDVKKVFEKKKAEKDARLTSNGEERLYSNYSIVDQLKKGAAAASLARQKQASMMDFTRSSEVLQAPKVPPTIQGLQPKATSAGETNVLSAIVHSLAQKQQSLTQKIQAVTGKQEVAAKDKRETVSPGLKKDADGPKTIGTILTGKPPAGDNPTTVTPKLPTSTSIKAVDPKKSPSPVDTTGSKGHQVLNFYKNNFPKVTSDTEVKSTETLTKNIPAGTTVTVKTVDNRKSCSSPSTTPSKSSSSASSSSAFRMDLSNSVGKQQPASGPFGATSVASSPLMNPFMPNPLTMALAAQQQYLNFSNQHAALTAQMEAANYIKAMQAAQISSSPATTNAFTKPITSSGLKIPQPPVSGFGSGRLQLKVNQDSSSEAPAPPSSKADTPAARPAHHSMPAMLPFHGVKKVQALPKSSAQARNIPNLVARPPLPLPAAPPAKKPATPTTILHSTLKGPSAPQPNSLKKLVADLNTAQQKNLKTDMLSSLKKNSESKLVSETKKSFVGLDIRPVEPKKAGEVAARQSVTSS